MIREIAPEIVKHAPDAIYILVSNPVDVLYLHLLQGVRPAGTGSSARAQSSIPRAWFAPAEYLSISQKSIHAYVMGEHGDSSFVPWSTARGAASKYF